MVSGVEVWMWVMQVGTETVRVVDCGACDYITRTATQVSGITGWGALRFSWRR